MEKLFFYATTGLAVGLATLFALWPEIQRRLSGSTGQDLVLPRSLRVGILLALPLATAVLYWQFGTHGDAVTDDPRIEQLRAQMIDMAQKLERDPEQPELWQRLGLIYKDIGNHGSAEHTLRRALYLRPGSAFLRTELAETLHRRSDLAQMPHESRMLLKQAIEIQPDNLKALWLLATDDFVSGNYATALAWWKQMLPLVPEDSTIHRAVRTETRRAREMMQQQSPD